MSITDLKLGSLHVFLSLTLTKSNKFTILFASIRSTNPPHFIPACGSEIEARSNTLSTSCIFKVQELFSIVVLLNVILSLPTGQPCRP